MFTGLIENTATLKARSSGKLLLAPRHEFSGGVKPGDSIAINGCCLTLEKINGDGVLEFHVLEETMRRTNLGHLPVGSILNMERAMQAGSRLDGHIVTGHIDCTGKMVSISQNGADIIATINFSELLKPFLISKGCIAVDGISLTPVRVEDDIFTIHLIPVTLGETALPSRRTGDLINLEGDLLAKYVQHQLGIMGYASGSSVTMQKLRDAGW